MGGPTAIAGGDALIAIDGVNHARIDNLVNRMGKDRRPSAVLA